MSFDFYADLKDKLSSNFEKLKETKLALNKAKNKIEGISNSIVKEKDSAHLARLYLKATDKETDIDIQKAWQKSLLDNSNSLNLKLITDLELCAPPFLENLLPLSFLLTLNFKLATPYISKDDTNFYIIENPVRKDWVFKVPYVAPSSWKGALRYALYQHLGKEIFQKDVRIARLFGKEPTADNHDEGQAGSLYFYPTFFDKLGLEIINPHDRETGVGKNPILIECVPKDTTGQFMVLYVPMFATKESEIVEDLKLCLNGIHDMFVYYGFGAKTSSGYGKIKETLSIEKKSTLSIHGIFNPIINFSELLSEPKVDKPPLAGYLASETTLKEGFCNSDGSLISKEDYDAHLKKSNRTGKKYSQDYEKAKKWWEREGKKYWENKQYEPNQTVVAEIPDLPITTSYKISKIVDLPSLSEKLYITVPSGK